MRNIYAKLRQSQIINLFVTDTHNFAFYPPVSNAVIVLGVFLIFKVGHFFLSER